MLYSNQDDIDVKNLQIPVEKRTELDRWIISKYNTLLLNVTEEMDKYDHMKAVRKIQDFVVKDEENNESSCHGSPHGF